MKVGQPVQNPKLKMPILLQYNQSPSHLSWSYDRPRMQHKHKQHNDDDDDDMMIYLFTERYVI